MKNPKPSPPSPAAGPGAQELWLAGLDVLSQATKAATEAATQAANQAASHVASLAASASAPPSLEGLFEARVAKAMARLGTPTRAEIEALSAQVEHLQDSLKTALKTIDALTAKPAKAGQAEEPAKKARVAKVAKVAKSVKQTAKPAKAVAGKRAGQS